MRAVNPDFAALSVDELLLGVHTHDIVAQYARRWVYVCFHHQRATSSYHHRHHLANAMLTIHWAAENVLSAREKSKAPHTHSCVEWGMTIHHHPTAADAAAVLCSLAIWNIHSLAFATDSQTINLSIPRFAVFTLHSMVQCSIILISSFESMKTFPRKILP